MRRSFATWAFVYALCVIYVSVVIGPAGFHYVPRGLGEAWQVLLATRYVSLGSDQRADWMANLVMTIPLGFLWAGAFWLKNFGVNRWLQVLLTLLGCVAFVIIVKYAQLFFPPRTVNLNYILAQCIGSASGITLFWVSHQRQWLSNRMIDEPGARALRFALIVYAVAFILFVLFPFDFVLTPDDVSGRIAVLSTSLFSWPGADRSFGIRLLLILANIVETMPLGVLLVGVSQPVSLWRTAAIGFLTMSVLTFAASFVMSATPFLVSIVFRTIGICLGAALAANSQHWDLVRLRSSSARAVPLLVVPYVLGVLYIDGLLSSHWRTLEEARATLDVRGLLPLWHYYIVSKAHGLESLAVHAVTFAPIGIMISLRSERGHGGGGIAGTVAFVFSFGIELGRAFKPGLQADFNSPLIAAISAWIAVKSMPIVWQMLESLSVARASPLGFELSKKGLTGKE